MKNLMISYLLCSAGLFTPFAGFHRFYLDRPISGIFYFLTWGFFGIGTVIDLIRMPALVDHRNLELIYAQKIRQGFILPRDQLSSPERSILRCANDNQGVVTIPMASLNSKMTMAEAKNELDRLYREGFCEKDVDEDGNEIYCFKGLRPKRPLI